MWVGIGIKFAFLLIIFLLGVQYEYLTETLVHHVTILNCMKILQCLFCLSAYNICTCMYIPLLLPPN